MRKLLLGLSLATMVTGGCASAYRATAENQYDWTDRYHGVGRLKEMKRRVLPMREVSGLAWDAAGKGLWLVNDGRRLSLAFLKDPLGADMFDATAQDLSKFSLPKSREHAWAEWPDFEAVAVEPAPEGPRLWLASELERQAWRLDIENKKVDEVVGLPVPVGQEGTQVECTGGPSNRSIESLAVARAGENRVFYVANERCPAEIIRKEEKPDRLTRITQSQFERMVTDYMLKRWTPPVQPEGGKARVTPGERLLCPGVPRAEALGGEQTCRTGSITDLVWQPEQKRLWILLRHSRLVAAVDWSDQPRIAGLWSFLGKIDEMGSSVRFGNAEGLAIQPPDPANGGKGALYVVSDPGDNVDSELIGFELPEIEKYEPAAKGAATPQK